MYATARLIFFQFLQFFFFFSHLWTICFSLCLEFFILLHAANVKLSSQMQVPSNKSLCFIIQFNCYFNQLNLLLGWQKINLQPFLGPPHTPTYMVPKYHVGLRLWTWIVVAMTIHLSDHKLQGASLNQVPCCCALNSISTLTQASLGTARNQLLSTAGILRQACSMGFLWWATLVQGLSTTLLNCPLIAQQPEALSLPNVLPSLLHWDQTGTFWRQAQPFKSPFLFSFIDVSRSKILAHLILSRCLFLKTPLLIYRGYGHHQIITSHRLLPRGISLGGHVTVALQICCLLAGSFHDSSARVFREATYGPMCLVTLRS